MRRTFTLIAIAASYAAAIRVGETEAPAEMTEEVVAPDVVENEAPVAPAGEHAAPEHEAASNPEAEQAILNTINDTLNKPLDAQNSQPGGLNARPQKERKD